MFDRSLFSWCLVLAVGACACTGVEPLQEPAGPVATSLSIIKMADETLAPGESTTVEVQALDAKGQPVNGARVYFLATEEASLAFDGKEAGDMLVVTTADGDALGGRLAGLAAAAVTAPVDAPQGDTELVAGLVVSTADPPGEAVQLIELTIEPQKAE